MQKYTYISMTSNGDISSVPEQLYNVSELIQQLKALMLDGATKVDLSFVGGANTGPKTICFTEDDPLSLTLNNLNAIFEKPIRAHEWLIHKFKAADVIKVNSTHSLTSYEIATRENPDYFDYIIINYTNEHGAACSSQLLAADLIKGIWLDKGSKLLYEDGFGKVKQISFFNLIPAIDSRATNDMGNN